MKHRESLLHRLCGVECGWYGLIAAVFVMLALLTLIFATRMFGLA